MKTTPIFVTATLVSLFMAGGMSTTTPNYDKRYGEAVRTAVAQQTINPDASKNTDPVTGLDGKAAEQTINNYDKSFSKPEKNTTLSISVGD